MPKSRKGKSQHCRVATMLAGEDIEGREEAKRVIARELARLVEVGVPHDAIARQWRVSRATVRGWIRELVRKTVTVEPTV